MEKNTNLKCRYLTIGFWLFLGNSQKLLDNHTFALLKSKPDSKTALRLVNILALAKGDSSRKAADLSPSEHLRSLETQ